MAKPHIPRAPVKPLSGAANDIPKAPVTTALLSAAAANIPKAPAGSTSHIPKAPVKPLLSGASLGFASPVLTEISKKRSYIESMTILDGNAEAASSKGKVKEKNVDSEDWEKLISMAREALELLDVLKTKTLPEFIESIKPLQTKGVFVGAIPADIPPTTEDSSLTDCCRMLLDSLVGKIVDALLDGKSWAGQWKYHDVLVTEGHCVFKVPAGQLGDRDNTGKDLEVLHGLIDQLFTQPYPPHIDHLLNLLLNVPANYDTNKEVKERFLLSIKHHCSLASLARIVTLVLNFAQCRNCLPEATVKNLRLILATVMSQEVFMVNWINKVQQHKLLQDVRKPPKKRRKIATHPDVNDLFDLSYYFRNFTVHAPDYMLDIKDEVQLKDYLELYHIFIHHFGNVMPDLVMGMFEASHLHPLVKSSCEHYMKR